MSCKSALYAANTQSQTLVTGGTVNFGSIVRKYGCNLEMSGGNPVVAGYGYYGIDVNISFTAGDAGDVIIALYKDGTPITGAKSTTAVAASSAYSVSIPAIIREACNCESTVTVTVSGVPVVVDNAAVVIEKL